MLSKPTISTFYEYVDLGRYGTGQLVPSEIVLFQSGVYTGYADRFK